MVDFLLSVLQVLWQILEDASVFLLFGFLLAGVLAVLVRRRLVYTGKGRLRERRSRSWSRPQKPELTALV